MYFDRANNYWVAAVSLGYKAGKRVRRKVTGRTKTEVKAKLQDLRRDLDSGFRSSATYTVGAAPDDWLANGLSGRSDRTGELYRDTVKPLRERLGDVKLRELTAGDVQETLDAPRAAFHAQPADHSSLPGAGHPARRSPRSCRPERGRPDQGRGRRAGRPSKSLTLRQAQELLRAAARRRAPATTSRPTCVTPARS